MFTELSCEDNDNILAFFTCTKMFFLFFSQLKTAVTFFGLRQIEQAYWFDVIASCHRSNAMCLRSTQATVRRDLLIIASGGTDGWSSGIPETNALRSGKKQMESATFR